GVPVVIHDATVDATTDGSGPVAALTLAQLKRLDAGTHFAPQFVGETIPTLEEVLTTFGHRLLLNVELKSTSLRDDGLERAVMAQISRHDMTDRVLISSFNPFALRRAKQLAPHVSAGLLYAPDLPLPLRRAWLAFVAPHEARHPQHTMVDAQYVAWARRRGYRVHPWTVDDVAEMKRLVGLGVDAVITNRPDLLRDLLASAMGES
ncbi:MAG TPA: glycerophosphodiester phosphodiesterase, partial [Chloroflexi bacterium]|nr:glycerophosphodiester phosphodiesterase [Chloroflexota bacterium]